MQYYAIDEGQSIRKVYYIKIWIREFIGVNPVSALCRNRAYPKSVGPNNSFDFQGVFLYQFEVVQSILPT